MVQGGQVEVRFHPEYSCTVQMGYLPIINTYGQKADRNGQVLPGYLANLNNLASFNTESICCGISCAFCMIKNK